MKIIRESQTNLIIKQGIFVNIITGIILLLIGIWSFFESHLAINTALFFGVIFTLVGIAAIATAQTITITVDKTTNKISFLNSRIFGKNFQELDINQIKEVSLEEYVEENYAQNNQPRNQLIFNLVFYLQDGQAIPFRLPTQNLVVNGIPLGMFANRNKNVVMANKIAAFIGAPFVNRRPPTLTQAITGVVEAIKNSKPQGTIQQINQSPSANTALVDNKNV